MLLFLCVPKSPTITILYPSHYPSLSISPSPFPFLQSFFSPSFPLPFYLSPIPLLYLFLPFPSPFLLFSFSLSLLPYSPSYPSSSFSLLFTSLTPFSSLLTLSIHLHAVYYAMSAAPMSAAPMSAMRFSRMSSDHRRLARYQHHSVSGYGCAARP